MADFPHAGDTLALCQRAEKAGADLLEIGMPFSDPIADGPTIQRCSEAALKNGFSIERLFQQIERIRDSVSIPLVLMGYLNPVMQFGIERFCSEAQRCGIDGLILPDLPMREYLEQYQALFQKHGLVNVPLITSRTTPERIRFLDQNSEGFLYLVSSEATTGGQLVIGQDIGEYFARISAMKLKNPTIVGFGIADHAGFSRACEHTNGAIVASAFLRRLESQGTSAETVSMFVDQIRGVK